MTVTSFTNTFLWSCLGRHSVGKQIVRPFSSQNLIRTFVDAQRLKFVNISLSISVCLAIRKLLSSDYNTHTLVIEWNLVTLLHSM